MILRLLVVAALVAAMPSIFDPLAQPPIINVAHRRGGWRQAIRARKLARTPKTNAKHTRLNSALRHLQMWGSGLQTATKLWWHMDGMRLDGTENHACIRLAGIGSSSDGGKHSQKNLLDMMAFGLGLDEYITAIDSDGQIRDLVLPSSFYRMLSKKPALFRRHLGARPDDVENFWRNLFSSPRGQRLRRCHPQLVGKSPSDLRHSLPLWLHEDSGPFSKRHSTTILNFGSLLGTGKDFQVRFQVCSFLKTKGEPYDSGFDGWEAILEDFGCLATGCNDCGEPFVCIDGINWGGILTFGGADMEQLCIPWGLPGYGDEEPCFECDCDRTDDKPWTNLVRVSILRRT